MRSAGLYLFYDVTDLPVCYSSILNYIYICRFNSLSAFSFFVETGRFLPLPRDAAHGFVSPLALSTPAQAHDASLARALLSVITQDGFLTETDRADGHRFVSRRAYRGPEGA